jgi:hypothetical protein
MLESSKMPTKPVTPDNAKKHTSVAGPHGGGNTYHQLTVGRDFAVHDPIKGHTQKQNITIPKAK